jgi:hypothetical protein
MNRAVTLERATIFFLVSALVLFLGFAIAVAPIYIAIFSLIPIFIIFSFVKFRLAVLGMLFIASGFIPSQLLPSFTFGTSVVRAEECFLILLCIIGFIRIVFRKNIFINSSLYYPVYFLFLLSVFSTVLAIGFRNKPSFILIELRIILYYIFVFLIALGVSSKKELNSTLKIVVTLSIILSLTVIIQSVTGIQLRNYGAVTALNTADSIQHGITRSRFGGLVFLAVFSFVYTLARLSRKELSSWVAISILGIIGFAILVTFGRATWMGCFISVLVLSIWLGWRNFIHIWIILIPLGMIGIMSAFLIQPTFVDAIVTRAMSVGEEVHAGSSYEWRQRENKYAMQTIQKNPILGVGLGGEFKRPERDNIMQKMETHFLHNSWLWFILKFGVLGIVFPIWWVLVVLRKAKKLNTSLSISCASTLLAPVVVGATQMEWTTPFGILGITTMIGLLVAHSNLLEKNNEQTKTS